MNTLKEILGEELHSQVTEALKGKAKDGKDIELAVANDGSFLPKGKFDDLNTEVKGLREQLHERDNDIVNLKKNSGDNDTLKTQIKELQTKYQTDTDTLNQQIKDMHFSNALDLALTTNKARNAKAVKALLNLDEVKFEDGKVTGLDAQLESIKQDNSYLFDGAEDGNKGNGYSYQPVGGGKTDPDFSKMSDEQYYEYVDAQKKG